MSGELIVVIGPTGSGKSAAAVALARRLNGEVINADAMQLYRGDMWLFITYCQGFG